VVKSYTLCQTVRFASRYSIVTPSHLAHGHTITAGPGRLCQSSSTHGRCLTAQVEIQSTTIANLRLGSSASLLRTRQSVVWPYVPTNMCRLPRVYMPSRRNLPPVEEQIVYSCWVWALAHMWDQILPFGLISLVLLAHHGDIFR